MSLRLAAISGTLILALSGAAGAQCADATVPSVELYAGASDLAPMAAALSAGLSRSDIRVCAGERAAQRVARVDVSRRPGDSATFRIVVLDDVTRKTVERSISVGGMPEDSRAIALSVYVEELLQASWAELALAQRTYLRERAASAPEAVRRELLRVVPASSALSSESATAQPAAAESGSANGRSRGSLRVFTGTLAAAYGGGMIQAGVELGLAVRLAPWLDAGMRGMYLYSPSARASHGRIDAQAAATGLYLEPVLQLSPAVALRLPQAVDLQRVSFRALPDRGAGGRPAVRAAVVVSHGIGSSFALAPSFALSVIARLCWALLPAGAADDMVVATGLSGLGGQLEILFDATF